MKRTSTLWALGVHALLILAASSFAQERVAAPKSADPIEVQTRGPLHDAIAQPVGVKPEPGPLVAKEPPAPIPETPPDQKPNMDNVQWVPGYWAWDAQQQQFMWISGVYRVPPQDRSYVPGYWASTADGWRWVPGFWSSGKLQDSTYTPEPPAPLDKGPVVAAPDDDSLYVPGTWVWQQDRFVWRPGYWSAAQDGRVWVPPHYQWTPNGYVYVDGYWDYPLEDRGMIFAPVTFGQPLWNDPNWSYQPNYVVSPNSFLDSAFVNGPGFYFGNYYNPRDARAGFNPWYTGRGRYDPVFAYYGWKNPRWSAGVQQTYAGRTSGQLAAPPLTLAQQGLIGGISFVVPLNQVGKQVRLVSTTSTQQAAQRTGIQQSRQLAVTRQQFEAGKSTNSLRLTAGSNSSSGPVITNGNPGGHGVTYAGPKITNEARNVTPNTSGPRIVNSPSVIPARTISPAPKVVTPAPKAPAPKVTPPVRRASNPTPAAPVHVSAPVRTVHAAPARPVSAPRPAAGHKR